MQYQPQLYSYRLRPCLDCCGDLTFPLRCLKSSSKFTIAYRLPTLSHPCIVPSPRGRCAYGSLIKAISQAPKSPCIPTHYQYFDPGTIIYRPQGHLTLSDKPSFFPYIRGSSTPTLNLLSSGISASACPCSLPPHNGALLHPQSHSTSRSSQRQPSTPPRGIAHHHMDPVGTIRVRVCVIPTYLFIALEGSAIVW
jgi:hypothetical protein